MAIEGNFEIKNAQENPLAENSAKKVENFDTVSTISSEQKENRAQEDNARIAQLRAELTGNESKESAGEFNVNNPNILEKLSSALGIKIPEYQKTTVEGLIKNISNGYSENQVWDLGGPLGAGALIVKKDGSIKLNSLCPKDLLEKAKALGMEFTVNDL